MNSQRAPDSPSGTKPCWLRVFNVHFLPAPFLIFSYFFNPAILDIRNVGWLLHGGGGSDLSMSFVYGSAV